MAERPLYTLYKNLKAQNYDVPNDYNKFESALTRDGKSGANNRHAIYENLKAQNFDVPDTYERFYTALFEPRSKTSSRAKGGSVPMSAADRARFLSGAAAISASAKQIANNAGRYNRLKQRKQKQQKDFGRVNLGTHLTPFGGDANDVVKDEFAYNPETGKAGAYVTSDNENAYTQSDAEQKQAILDKYGEEWNKAVDMGMVPSELDKADPDMSDTDVAMRQMERRQEWLDENQNRRSKELNESMHLQDSPFVASGGAVAPSSFNTAIGNEANRLSDAEYGAYNTAKAYNQMLRTTLLQELKEQKQRNEDAGWWKDKWNDVSNYFGAMFNTMLDPKLYSQGVMDAAIASNLLQVKKGMEDGTIKKGSNAGNAAQVMLSAIQQQQGEAAKQQQNGAKAYQYGDVSGRSLKFMGDFALSGWRDVMTTGFTKAGEKVGEKMALGALGKWFTKNTGRVLGDMAGSAALAATNQLGSTYNNVIERYVGMNNENGGVAQDKDGDLKFNEGVSLGKAIKDGFGSATIENFSEMFGEYLPGASKLLSKLGLSKVSSFFEKIGNNAYYKWLSNATNKSGIQGVMSEIAEEEFGTALHAAWGDGDGSWSDFNVFTNPDAREKQIDTCLGMFYSVGFMQSPRTAVGAINAVKYFSIKLQVTKADKFGQMMFGDNWEEIKSKIDVTTNADLTKTVLDATRSDSMTAKQKGAVINYAMFLSKLRGFNQASDAKTKDKVEEGETVPTLSNYLDDAYTEGHNADDADKHDIQVQHEDQSKTLAAALNISEQQLSGMSDEELESLTGQDDKLDQAIYDYQLSTARYQGVVDDAQDKVDLAAHQAEQRVNMYTDQSRGSVRNATIKASGGAEDYGVYIISGNIATHEDGSIDVSNSDDMILYYDPTTNSVEHADAMMFAELGSEENADEVRSQAMADAKEKAIKETTGIIDGVVEVGTQFKTLDADGTEHTYEVLADNGDGTAMITIDGNIPTELVNGENVNIPVSFEELQKMKDEADQQRLQAAKAQREQMEKERAEQQMQSQTTQAENPAHDDNIQSAPIEDNIDYSDIIREDGKVQMVDVSDKYGNNLFPDAKDVFYIQGNKMRTKFAYIDANGELKTQSFPTGLVKIKIRGEVSVDDYKKYRNTILAAESSFIPESSKIEDNSGENRGEIEVETPTTEGKAAGPAEETATSESGEDSATEQTPAITLEDGTIVPMLEDGNPDFSKLSAAQTAELYDTQFDEDADGIVSGYVSDAKKALDKANNMTVKGKTFVEQKAAKAAKEKAIADAQAAYDSAVAIRDAYNERQLVKEENTPEGRKSLIEKARRKYARLKNSEEWSERTGDLWNETVGKLLHRLYDATGIDVFDDTPNTVYEYVASNVGPYSLNYEGNDNSKGVQQETGLSRSDFAKLGWLAAEGKGMTIDAKVHRLWENRPSNLESADTQEIRNALISLITSGQTAFQARDYIMNQRIELAESALEEQLRQEEDAAETQRAKEEEEKKKAEEKTESDKSKEESKAIEVPEDATDDAPLGEQLDESDLPFSAKENGQQQTTAERAADVEKNKVDDMKVVDNIVGQKTRKTLERLAKMMGANVQWQYSDKNANGWFDDKTNTIYLTLDSSITEGVQFIFGHEMTHEMRTKNPAAYDELKTLVKDMMGEDAFNSETDRITSLYNENNVFYNGGRTAYEEEVVADQLGKWIRDANYAHTLLLKMSHPLLAKLHEIVNRFLMALHGIEISDDMNLILRSIEQAYVKTANGQVVNSETGEDVSFSLRQKPEPKKKGIGYKVFVLKDGKLYPPMVANPDGAATPVGVWLDADAAPIAGESKTGRPQVKQGGKGTQGGSGKLAYRPGWHLGVVPYAIQFNRKDAEGNKTLFPKNFVFAEVEYAADVDYQEEARQEGINPSGKYQHSLAGLKHLPTDGYYMYRTNPNPETDPWVITGAMKVNRILTRAEQAEQAELVKNAGREPQQIQEGDIVNDDVVNSINQEIADAPKFSLKVYHGSGADFTEFDFDHMSEGAGSQAFGWGGYVTSSEKIGKSYAKITQQKPTYIYNGKEMSEDDFQEEILPKIGSQNENMFMDFLYNLEKYGVSKAKNILRKGDYGYYKNLLKGTSGDTRTYYEGRVKAAEVLLALHNIRIKKQKTNLYEVDIPEDNGSNYLDWDASIPSSINKDNIIKDILDNIQKQEDEKEDWELESLENDINDSLEWANNGEELYKAISLYLGDKTASKLLASLGYTGIKYKAGRNFGGAEKGDTNYVIFKPEDMRITEHTKFSIKTYHGSQASFDHFDHSFMGSGEGAQAYGWGTYVSEVEGIAKAYAKQNAKKNAPSRLMYQGKPMTYKTPSIIYQVAFNMDKFNISAKEVISQMIDAGEKKLASVGDTPFAKMKAKQDQDELNVLKGLNPSDFKINDDYDTVAQNLADTKSGLDLLEDELKDAKSYVDLYQSRLDEAKKELSKAKESGTGLGVDMYESDVAYYSEQVEKYKQNVKTKESDIKDVKTKIDALQKKLDSIGKPRNLYSVDIPDDTGDNYIGWDEPITPKMLEAKRRVMEEDGYTMYDSDGNYDYFEKTENGKYQYWQLWNRQKGNGLYNELSKVLHSDKLASLALNKHGIVGVKVIANRNTGGNKEGNMNYVIFDENNAQITNHTKFSLRLKSAIEETDTNPSDAQKENGNYKKGHIKFGGYDYTIENPKGSTRSGKDANGKEWKVTMHDTYGYIRGKFGKDGDHLDMFINDKADLDNWNGDVFVVDQVNPDGSFDEHKVMYGYDSMDDAEKAYLANYSDGWQGLGNITGASKDEFDKWLDTSNRKLKPFEDYANVKFSLKDIKPVGVGAFGNIYNQFHGDAKAAIEFLKKVRGGEAVGALHHKDIGDIDLVWGKEGTGHSDGYGLSKLVKYHPEVLDNLQEILNDMRVVSSSKNRVNLESETHKAGVRLTWDGERKSWLLTAFKKETSASDKRTDTAATSLEGDTALSQTEGSAAKIDNSSETAKENGEKFSLKYEKTLAGVHNITEEKLLKAIKQGGLANPSVAVIDSSKQNHEDYGDISLILPSDKVAKKTGKNAGTWQGDAWTPTYPQVERQMSNKGAAKASKDVSSVPGDMYREVRRGLDRWLDGGEANSAMAYMFLYEKGVAPEPKKIQHKFGDDVYNELKLITAGDFNIYGIGKADDQKVLDMYIDAKFDGDKDLYEEKTKAWLKKNKSIVDAGNKGGMRYTIAKENVELYDEYGFNYKGVQTFVRDVEYDHRKTGVDMNATLNEVEDYIKTNNLTDEFITWLEGKEKEYGIKEVIFDGFTPSGNRRYVPNTLENVSKIMKKQGRNGATGISVSFQNFAASLMPSYGTLKNIRSKKGLLTSDHEDLDNFNEKWSKVFFELGMKCQPDATGTFDDYGLARLSEAAKTSAPQAYLKKEYNVDFSDEDTKRLKEMVKAIKEESPAMYFETKFERPVGFNEFSSAVVPTTASDEVKQALKNAGVQIYEYDKEKEGDRNRAFNEAINSSDNIRFSLKAMMEKPEGWKQANKKAIHIAEAIERDPKFSLKNLDGTLIKAGTYFSGGGLVEEGLKGIIDPVVAVEYDEKISGVYRNNFGQHIVTADVRDVDPKELVKQIDGEVEYFHASPVCKNYSQAKSNHAEVELDKETAASTAEFINAVKPKVVTIENVKGYKDSDAMKTITDALDANGYTWDADVYNAADYGGYTNRERLIVRAVRDGKLPAKPEKMARKSGWYEAVADIIPTLTEKKNGVAPWMDIRLKADGIDWRNIDKPLYVMGSAYADGKIPHAFADELLPTLRTKSGDVIVMPDGKVYRAMGRVLARVSGVSDDYKMPFSENLSHTIIGNGIPTQLTEHVIAPLLTGSDPKFSIRTYHGTGANFDKFDFSHMGEGEGSQAFGWGGYVTNSKDIAEDYTRRAKIRKDNGGFEFVTDLSDSNKDMVRHYIYKYKDVDKGLDTMRKDLSSALEMFPDDDNLKELSDILAKKNEEIAVPDNIAYLYDVDIPDDNGDYLDWDAPLTDKQKNTIIKELRRLKIDFADFKKRGFSFDGSFGGNAYDFLMYALRRTKKWKDVDASRAVSKFLSSIGFTGIKYKAGNIFGGAKEGDYNYVIFDENNANIVGNTRFSLRGSTPYDKQMEEWMEKNHLEKGAVPMEKPIMKEGENIFDYANRMIEWTRNQNLWKTAPKQTGFQDALDKWKADNGLSPDAYPPVRPHRENYSTEIGYSEDLEEYNKKKELWKSAPKPKDFDLSVDLEDMNKQLRNIRRAVLNQKNYDQRTIKAVSDLVRKMLNIGWGDGLSRGKVGNLLSAAKNATGANDVKKYLDKAMGILAENYLNRLSTAYDNLINTKGARADQSGVIKMGSLDAKGQAFISEYKKAINMDDKSLNTYIANIEEDSAKNEDNVEMNDYRLAGIQAAIMYKQQIGGNDADISELKRQIGELKNKKDTTKEDKELLKSLEKKLFENKFDRITMFENLLNNIQRMVKESKGRAKEFREEIAEHKNEILHRANLDLEGVDSTYYDTTTAKKKFVNNDLQRAVFSSTYTFEQFLKFFGKHSANGEGRLYNYFHKLNQDALDEEQLYNEMNRNALDEKTKELFGKEKFMKLVGIDSKGMKEMDIEVTDYSNKKTGKRTIHLKQGQMLYIYLVNKETDGEMKLRAMGITEEDVAAIEENLDPRVKAMGVWLQDEYLPECQRRYQATHTKYFGAPMKEVENYFPLAINNRARNVKEDVNQDSDAMSQLAGTSTGAIVTRRVNVIPLDIENADAFEVAFNHLQEMEEWSAMLPFRQDINTLLSYTHFRNQVQNMSSVAYGSGKTLWDEFKQTAQIAAGTYKPKVNAGMMDSRIAAAMGGIAVAKISGRLWTAIKQSQSATVFLPECDFTRFVKNGVNPYGSWKWAMETIPDFRKRVENMTYGDVKLRQYLDELEKWHDWTKTISKIGMAPNILVDGITCAVGARSVYETEVNRLTKLGYPKDKADEKAYYKAVAAYNKTQQSSGGMYLSPMQVDRTYVSAALSLFKNANYAYGRMQIEACRGLARTYDFWGGKHKTTLIESMTRQIMGEDGLNENTARTIAKATYNRTFRQSIGRLINFATLIPVTWALYKVLPYLLTGDDDDKKKDMIEEAVLKGFVTSLSDNYVIPFVSNILNAGLKVEDGKPTFNPEVFRYQNLYINPATSDLANIYSMVGNQKWYSVVNKLGMLGVQSLIGFNPETVGALYQAFAEADYDNGNTAKEWQIGILKAISAPEESIRELYMDELGLKSGDIKKIPLAELEKRYAERQINRDNLLSQIGMDSETFNGYVDKYQKSFEKKIKDKMDKWDEYDKKKADEFFDTTSDPKLKDMIEKKRAKDANAAADEQIAKEGLSQEKKGKELNEEAYDAVKVSIDVAEDNAISTYNKVLNKRYAALNDEYNEQTDAMKYIFMSKHPNFKAYKDLKSEYTTYGKKIKKLKEKLVSADGYDAKQTILKQIRAEREKFSKLQSKVR